MNAARWLFPLLSIMSTRAHACSPVAVNRLVVGAQNLDKAVLNGSEPLLRCPSRAVAEQALQWRALLTDLSGNHAASRQMDLPPLSRSGREGVLAAARAGNYRPLLAKVDEQEAEFATAADAQLVLARVLTRKGLFARGRAAYELYLKLVPDDDDAEIERLYGYIWAGQLAEASGEFARARGWSSRPAYQAALARGQVLIQRLGGDQAPAVAGAQPASAESPPDGRLLASFGYYRTLDLFARRSYGVDYRGPFSARLASHSLHDLGLTKAKAEASELSVGATLGQLLSWHVQAHVGYFTLGHDHYTGDISAGVPLGRGWMLLGGSSETPLDLLLPLSPDAAGTMRDAVFLELRQPEWFELHAEMQKERDFKPHATHRALGRWPLLRGDEHRAALILPVTYESYPQPVALYDTYLRTVTAGVGCELRETLNSRVQLSGKAVYSWAFVTERDLAATTEQVGVIEVDAEASLPLTEQLHLLLTGHYVRAQDDDYERRHAALTSILIGLGYGA